MAAQRIELVASAAQTAAGNSDAFSVPNITMAMVTVDKTASSAPSEFTCWLEGSDDGGTTWFELVHDHAMISTGVAAATAPTTNVRDIVDGDHTLSKHMAVYKHLCADKVRLRWTFSGTSLTFSSSLVGK